MFNKDKWNEILEILTTNWVRTLLTAFGVFWGIFILIILLSAANGMKRGIMAGFNNFATNTMFVWAGTTSRPYKGMKENRSFTYNSRDAELLKQKVKGIKVISPKIVKRNISVVRGSVSEKYTISGEYPDFIIQNPLPIIQGDRFINYGDIQNNRKVCMLEEGMVLDLYKNTKNVIGTNIIIRGTIFTVVGVYKGKRRKYLYIPFSTFKQLFNVPDEVFWMIITAEDDVPMASIEPKIVDILKENHKIHPEDNTAVGHYNLAEAFNQIQMLGLILQFIGFLVGGIILISGVIGVGNIMLVVVKERTKEIGIRRALGAKPKEIRSQIISESVFLTLISGAVGISFATLIIWIVNIILDQNKAEDIMFKNPSVDISTVLIAFLILIVSGILAGLIPAQVAIKIKPVDALRTE